MSSVEPRQPTWSVISMRSKGLASALLAIEFLVQIPFLGFSNLQLIFGAVASGMAVLAILAVARAGGHQFAPYSTDAAFCQHPRTPRQPTQAC